MVAQIIRDWLDTAELEQSTRDGYQSYIDNQILPALDIEGCRYMVIAAEPSHENSSTRTVG
jgi:hypothetical protein